jgi:GGDEF domain-containing protein
VATREALLQRLEIVGALSPESPLSFLVADVEGMAKLREDGDAATALEAISRSIVAEIGPLDLAGRYTASSFGVILQGKGSRATSALAAKLQYSLNRLPELVHPMRVDVFAATGTGANATVLPIAAGDDLPDIG